MMNIELKKISAPVFYHCISANRTLVGSKKIEFISDKVIELSVKEDVDFNLLFTYKLLASNLQGSGIIHQWAGDIEKLQDKIIFKTDKAGKLISIENRINILAKWTSSIKLKMWNKYKKYGEEGAEMMVQQTTELLRNEEMFFKSFIGFNLYHIFFQGHYKKYEPNEKSDYNIKNYFGSYDLPIIMQNEIFENDDKSICIKRKGELNKEKFEQDKFTLMIKQLTGVIDINASLNVEHEENYVFDKNNLIKSAELFLKTDAANMYALASAHSVNMIDENEVEKLIYEFAETKPVDVF
jgi:hypothetical protein